MELDHYIELTTKKLSNSLTSQEEEEFNKLIENDKEFQEIYNDAAAQWQLSGKFELKYNPKPEAHWQEFQNRTTQPQGKQINLFPLIYKIAASIVLLVGIMYVFNYTLTDNSISYVNDSGETQTVELPDGSLVWLNANSSLLLDSDFGNQTRESELNGEAYFEVSHDASKPFQVNSNESYIRVLGTKFNISSTSENTKVSVSEGKVAFGQENEQGNKLVLTKGMAGHFNAANGELILIAYNANDYSWQSGQLEFVDANLSEVIKDLEKYFKIKIRLTNKDLAYCKYTGKFDEPDLDKILKILSLTLDVTYENRNGTYYLSGEGCTAKN